VLPGRSNVSTVLPSRPWRTNTRIIGRTSTDG
jgi:hypothetical protein